MSANLARRRAQNPFSGIINVRPLTTADMADLKLPAPPVDIRKLRAIHHEIADFIAAGYTRAEVANITGYTVKRIQELSVAPAMQELIAKSMAERKEARRAQIDEMEAAATATMKLGERVINEYVAEVMDSNEPKSLAQIRAVNKLVVDRMDRFGYGRQQTNMNINANFATKLEAAINRSAEAKQPKTIEVDHD